MYSFLDLIDDINWHQSRQLRTCCDEPGFVMVSATKFWTDMLIRHFVTAKDVSQDDMLFFVRKQPKKETRHVSKLYDTFIDVFRNDSKKLPIGDTQIDWEETLYLNVIMHKFEYSVTCAVCTRTGYKEIQILKKHTQKVFASPSYRSMDCKGDNEQMSYPNIFFTIDSYEDLLSEILVRDGEMICVELLAKDRCGETQGVIFLGCIQYQALKRVYDARSSLLSRFCRKTPRSYFQGQQRIEFVRMKGPNDKGFAEMAVAKQKGANCETPTSDPGFSFTSFDMDDQLEVIADQNIATLFSCAASHNEQEDCYAQRRMSEGSNNLKNEISWSERRVKKSATENDCINSLCNVINEIEAGDFRDELNDTSYSSMWTMRGFSQSYHFWKENKRASSPSLHAYITYITLPWHHIIADLFNNRQQSILTF